MRELLIILGMDIYTRLYKRTRVPEPGTGEEPGQGPTLVAAAGFWPFVLFFFSKAMLFQKSNRVIYQLRPRMVE